MMDDRYKGQKTDWEIVRVTYEALQQYVVTIGETDPIYSNQLIAKRAGFQDIPLPATYPSLFWQAFHIPWLENHSTFMLNAQSFTYNEPLIINRDYSGQITLSGLRSLRNKQWATQTLQLYDQSKVVATIKTTLVLTGEASV